MRHRPVLATLLSIAAAAHAEKLTVDTGTVTALSAVAIDTASGKQIVGTMSGTRFVFNVQPGRGYDVVLKKPGGNSLRLIDLSWYDDEPAAIDAGPLGDDDRTQILQVLNGVARFTNNNRIIALIGDGQRAVAMLDLRRDSDFHSRQGSEIIQRLEIWYFKNEAGGWAKVQQQDRVVDRQRYTSADDFKQAAAAQTWQPVAAGLKISRGHDSTVIVDQTAATQPAK